jgi:DNA helicase II / ATP-dependent DNA helicase PcrA
VPDPHPSLVEGLNPAQREAVTTVDGPVLVVAEPGPARPGCSPTASRTSSATTGVSPFEILAITFTNKAAGEMAERVGGLVGGPLSDRMWVTTFHKACVRILRRELPRLGYKSGFTIYDAQDSQRLIAQLAKDAGVDPKRLSPKAIQRAISNAKDELVDFETYKAHATGWPEIEIAEVYTAYQDRLLKANALDFDDLIVKAVEVLQLFDPVLEHYRKRFRYLMVDEYQDTNRAQYHLVNLLAGGHRNVMVVGDHDQASTASAAPREEPAGLRARLPRRQRDPAGAELPVDADRARRRQRGHQAEHLPPPEAAVDRAGPRDPVVRYHADDERDEAAFIAEEIEKLAAEGLRFDEAAIFYRTNAQSRVLEEVLLRVGTPYRVIGGQRFYERKEIRDLLAYARLLVNPADDVSARRVINTPRVASATAPSRRWTGTPDARASRSSRPAPRPSTSRGSAAAPSARSPPSSTSRRPAHRARARPAAARADRGDLAAHRLHERAAGRALGRGPRARGEPARAAVGRPGAPRAHRRRDRRGGAGLVPRVAHAGLRPGPARRRRRGGRRTPGRSR